MSQLDRRTFMQLSSGAALSIAAPSLAASTPAITHTDQSVKVAGSRYSWDYTRSDDSFRLRDAAGRVIVDGTLQPRVVVAPAGRPHERISTPGKLGSCTIDAGVATFRYEGVNGTARVTLQLRFNDDTIHTLPVTYSSPDAADVVSLHYFTKADPTVPTLYSNYFVAPGLLSGSTVSPIVEQSVHMNENVWLGRGSFIPGLSQQWGLPVHYFCGFSIDTAAGQRNMYTSGRSHSFCCGLADLPAGDLFLRFDGGHCSLWIDYRGDLWQHLRGPGDVTLGATLMWTVASDCYQAIVAYYETLLQTGTIRRPPASPQKTAAILTPEFCTWGVQLERHKEGPRLTQDFVEGVYQELRASGMKAGLFSIDDKWEGTYGNLAHAPDRFPHFEEFLDRLRGDGFKIGLWAALMRCEEPSNVGLTEEHMLKRPDGTPYKSGFEGYHYYILDFTRPEVAKVLADLARRFIRRYKPDLLKFDFGYELPTVAEAAPWDKKFAGERLLLKGLEIAIPAMREEKPDLVVMYYNLSPLLLEYFDLHSSDDLYMAAGEYDVEANRRFYFSSLLGRLGVPTYGSTGYDWASAPEIWFDSAAVGTIGCLNDFAGDEQGESATPQRIARYNGIAASLRPTTTYEMLPLGTIDEAPTLGAHARSWARFEAGQLVLFAYRPLPSGSLNPLLERGYTDPRATGAIRGETQVLVTSKTSDSIARSNLLAIVPCGPGPIMIRRDQGATAELHRHYLGGKVTTEQAAIANGYLSLTAGNDPTPDHPLEWIEVRVP